MPDKKCPQCGLWSINSATSCDCGYNFEKGLIEGEVHEPVSIRKIFPFHIASLSLGIIGICTSPLTLWAFDDFSFYQVSHRGWLLLLGPILSLTSLLTGIIALVLEKTQRSIALIGIFLAILGLFTCSVIFYGFLVIV